MSDGHHVVLERDNSFLPELWAWYIIGVLVIFLRMGVRLRTVGWRSLAGDDYIAVLSLLFYTADAVCGRMIYLDGTNADVRPAAVDYLTDAEIANFTRGSKALIVAWYTYPALIWCMKFMVLFFYRRLMRGTLQMKLIDYFFWLCGVTYLAVLLTVTFSCTPFHLNWQIRPLVPVQCGFKPQDFYVTAILNVLTDAILLSLPIPMLWALQVRLSKKIAIGVLLSSGLFVIAAAIVRAALTLGAAPSGLKIAIWGVRETIVGILTVNMPILPPMFRKAFWSKGTYHSSHGTDGSRMKGRGGGDFELGSGTPSRHDKHIAAIEAASHGSQENIIMKDNHSDVGFGSHNVMVETSIEVQSHQRDEERSIEWVDGEKKSPGYNPYGPAGKSHF